mmetsp:Transcript_2561/g.4120  ORF Transcript_2561/g.4120 Transcript_2561/m.4120 type:complete len:260 (-) Transcript_2561:1065-1844(-)
MPLITSVPAVGGSAVTSSPNVSNSSASVALNSLRSAGAATSHPSSVLGRLFRAPKYFFSAAAAGVASLSSSLSSPSSCGNSSSSFSSGAPPSSAPLSLTSFSLLLSWDCLRMSVHPPRDFFFFFVAGLSSLVSSSCETASSFSTTLLARRFLDGVGFSKSSPCVSSSSCFLRFCLNDICDVVVSACVSSSFWLPRFLDFRDVDGRSRSSVSLWLSTCVSTSGLFSCGTSLSGDDSSTVVASFADCCCDCDFGISFRSSS